MIAVEQNLAIAALLLALVIVALLVFSMRIKAALRQQLQSQAVMQTDLRALCNAAVQMGERVNRMGIEIKLLQQRQQELGVRQDNLAHSEPLEAGFEQAIKLARKGSPVEELMEICNLSRGEAELIVMMHRLEPES